MLLAACSPDEADPVGKVEAEVEQALRNAAPQEVFTGVLAGQAVRLVVRDCEVFRSQSTPAGPTTWERVLAPEPYPFFTRCERQSMSAEAGGVTARLGRMALGAGGCCASGGTYHSGDGRHWVKMP
ncbi:hypothetical protein Acidovoranil_37310 [Acidovorax sp. FG27]